MSGPALVDFILSLAALAGLQALTAVLRARDAEDPLNRRLLFALGLGSALFLCRAGLSLTGWPVFAMLVRLPVALIPIAVLIVTEGVLRRHAPPWAKALIGGAAPLAVILALVPSGPGVDWDDLALMAYQIAGFLAAGWLILRRDRAGLSAAENRAAARLGLSLLLFLALAPLDFLGGLAGLPVRLAALAVLGLCWLALSVDRAGAGTGAALIGMALALAAALAGAWATGLGPEGAFLLAALALAAAMTAAVVGGAIAQGRAERSLGLLRHLAMGPRDRAGFLRGLMALPQIEGAALLGPDDLDGIDPLTLTRAFARGPVLRRGEGGGDPDAAEHAAALFERSDASHLMLVADDPPQILALRTPALGGGPRLGLELAALARVARLLEGGDGH